MAMIVKGMLHGLKAPFHVDDEVFRAEVNILLKHLELRMTEV
jgi:hypothetical protein